MKNIRAKRIASSLQREISDIIANELRGYDFKMVTVTGLQLANDLSCAKIYITSLFDQNKEQIISDLTKAKGAIKAELARRKFEIRVLPDLQFLYDESLAYADNIERIIKKINEDK